MSNSNIILLAAHRVVIEPLPQRNPRFERNKRFIDLPRSHAGMILTDYTAHGLAFTAKFYENGQKIPFVETGKTAAEAARKLRNNPHVRACRRRAWNAGAH